MKEIDAVSKKIMLDVDNDFSNKLSSDWKVIKQSLESLKKFDTTGIEPMIYISEAPKTELRDDVVGEVMDHNDVISNSSSTAGEYISLMKVVKND